MRVLVAGLALFAGCNPTNTLTLETSPSACALGGTVAELVVSALGDLPPAASLTTIASPKSTLTIGPFGAAVHVITVEGVDANKAGVAIGQTAPFTFGAMPDGPISIVYAAPDLPCATAAMGSARFGHRATLVSDGTVLFTGGTGSAGPVTLIERYDPPSATFLAAGMLPVELAVGHTATARNDGVLIIAGGSHSDGTATNESLQLSSDGLITAATIGMLTSARAEHAATRLSDGRILVTGGCASLNGDDCVAGSLLASSEIYDPATDSWSAGPSLAKSRSHHAALLRGDGTVLVVGGRIEGGEAVDAELLDLTASHSVPAAPLSGRAAALDTGAIVIAGGELVASSRVSLLPSPSEDAIDIGALGTARSGASITRLLNGELLVVGGLGGDGHASGAADVISSLGFVRALPDVAARVDHTATLLLDGSVLVAGGRDATGVARGDGQLFVHSLVGPYANLPAQTFASTTTTNLIARSTTHAVVANGRLTLTAASAGDAGRPGELALLSGMASASFDMNLTAGIGADGNGIAAIIAWSGDANYRFVQLAPGMPVALRSVQPLSPTGSVVSSDTACVGTALTAAELPIGDVAPLRISLTGGALSVYAGTVRLLSCTPQVAVPGGMIGIGSLGGEAIFSSVAVTRD